ncbi:hypothetical protein ALT717_20124 [Alteromonas macleodii]
MLKNKIHRLDHLVKYNHRITCDFGEVHEQVVSSFIFSFRCEHDSSRQFDFKR